jgi:hypothetical protein
MKATQLITLALLGTISVTTVSGQTSTTPFDKKFHAGISLNNYWTTLTGPTLAREYFTKPSIGFNLRAEYYFTAYAGIGIGLGYQQYGMGIINQDKVHSLGNPDSTYRERTRFHTLEVPISLVIRTPKDVIHGIRLSGSVGIVPLMVFKATDIFNSVEDGNHLITPVNDQYLTNDLLTQFTLGPEIDSGGTGLFQIHFVYSHGTRNVYRQGQGEAYNHSMGIRIAWLWGSKLNIRNNKQ